MEMKTTIKAEEGKQELFITRVFDLPASLVFKAYSEPELVEQWMGTHVVRLDNHSHGSYRFETSHNGKVVFSAHGTIHELIPDQKIIRTFEMENMPVGVQLELLEFIPLTSETSQLNIQIIYQSEEHRAAQLKMPFASGLNMAHNRLQEILTSLS